MREKHKHNSCPYDQTVLALIRASKQSQVADEQGNLEETNAQLVDGATGKVDPRVRDEIFLWSQGNWKSESIPRF